MVVVMAAEAGETEIDGVVDRVRAAGGDAFVSRGMSRTIVGLVGDVDLVASYADMLQVGTRNMQNFPLLQAVGGVGKPVMLKRGMNATIEEWLMAAEYIAQRGNLDIVLC